MKIALIGTSNSIIKNGYYHKLSGMLPKGVVDRYSLGATTSLTASYMIRKYNIADRYDFVILDFNINEYKAFFDEGLPPEHCVSFFSNACLNLIGKKCKPLVLILKDEEFEFVESYQERFATFFDIPTITLDDLGNLPFQRYSDTAHYRDRVQTLIAEKIYTSICNYKTHYPSEPELKNFNLRLLSEPWTDGSVKISNVGISKFHNSICSFNDLVLSSSSEIQVSTPGWNLKGILFFSDIETEQYVYIAKDSGEVLRKQLNLDYKKSGYFTRLIDWKYDLGFSNFTFCTCLDSDISCLDETVLGGNSSSNKSSTEFRLVDMLFVDTDVVDYGKSVIKALGLEGHIASIKTFAEGCEVSVESFIARYHSYSTEEKCLILKKKVPHIKQGAIFKKIIELLEADYFGSREYFRYLLLASCFERTKDFQNSVRNIEISMAMHQIPANTKLEYSKQLAMINRVEDAKVFLKKEILENPEWVAARKRLSIIYRNEGDYSASLDEAKKVYERTKKQNDLNWLKSVESEIDVNENKS